MKDHTIKFLPRLVPMIVTGRKTQTRRIIEPQPVRENKLGVAFFSDGFPADYRNCPHGVAGQIITVAGRPGIKLKVLSVRVERLHEITEEDAAREGVGRISKGCESCNSPAVPPGSKIKLHTHIHSSYREKFRCLWESINGKGSWDQNPFVWVIEFKRMEVAK